MSVRAVTQQEVSASELKAKKDALKGLKVAQLANYDDFLTDILVDQVYFWSHIRKNRQRYGTSRHLKEEQITRILQQCVILEKDAQKAVDQLMALAGVQKYIHEKHMSEDDKDHFKRHLRKYVNMYLSDCPFEVSTTNRYTIDTQEAAIAARKAIRKGDPIKYLVGVQVPITKNEEKDLDLTRRDFSIVMSSRKRLPSLFLGPARFANHDCSPNARLTTKGPNGMAVVAAKDIKVGEEIVVSYGDDYFGIDNHECLCGTCEAKLRNGWDPKRREEEDSEEDAETGEQESEPPNRARRGRLTSTSTSTSRTATPDNAMNSNGLKRKRGNQSGSSTPRKEPRLDDLRTSSFKHSPSRLRQELRLDEDEDEKGQLSAMSAAMAMPTPERSDSPASVFERIQNGSEGSTEATSESDHHAGSKSQPLVLDGDEPVTTASLWAMPLPSPRVLNSIESPSNSQVSSQMSQDAVDSDLSEMDDSMAVDEKSKGVIERKRKQRQSLRTRGGLPGSSQRSTSSSPTIDDPNDDGNIKARRPGDYTLTRRLLSAPFSRWNRCRVCKEYFVQFDAYQTRWACKRCERHSKLYGFSWPKTDRIGKNDREVRILDHRQINRFVHGEEERWIKKGKKTVSDLAQAEQLRRERGELTSDDEEVSFGANPRHLISEDWSTDEEDAVPGRKRKRAARVFNKTQKRDFNADGTLREKRPYNWSGKFVGRSNKRGPKSQNARDRGLKDARYKKTADGLMVKKRAYVKSGKYAGRAYRRQLVAEGKLPPTIRGGRRPKLQKNSALSYDGTNDKTPKQALPKEKKKKQMWKGWAIINEDGEEVSPPATANVRVPRVHPDVLDQGPRLDIKPEHINKPKKPRQKPVMLQQLDEEGDIVLQDAPPKKVAPKRVKGWKYLDEDGNEMMDPPLEKSSHQQPKQETMPEGSEDEEDEEDEPVMAFKNGRLGRPPGAISAAPHATVNVTNSNKRKRASTGTTGRTPQRAATKHTYAPLPDTDDDSERQSSFEPTDDEDEPPRKQRPYVISGKYVGSKARQVAARQATSAVSSPDVYIKQEDTEMSDLGEDEDDSGSDIVSISRRRKNVQEAERRKPGRPKKIRQTM